MVEKKWKKVYWDEAKSFIENYPRKLNRDVYALCEPPNITYNDFELGNWPWSTVVSGRAYSDDPKDDYYVPKDEQYWRILENHEEYLKDIRKHKLEYRDCTEEEYTEFVKNYPRSLYCDWLNTDSPEEFYRDPELGDGKWGVVAVKTEGSKAKGIDTYRIATNSEEIFEARKREG